MDLQTHSLKHEKSHKCEICGESFAQPYKVKEHFKNVHSGTILVKQEKNREICDICGQDYESKSRLKMHISSVHGMERNFQCPECNSTLSTRRTLIRHLDAIHKMSEQLSLKNDNSKFEIENNLFDEALYDNEIRETKEGIFQIEQSVLLD